MLLYWFSRHSFRNSGWTLRGKERFNGALHSCYTVGRSQGFKRLASFDTITNHPILFVGNTAGTLDPQSLEMSLNQVVQILLHHCGSTQDRPKRQLCPLMSEQRSQDVQTFHQFRPSYSEFCRGMYSHPSTRLNVD